MSEETSQQSDVTNQPPAEPRKKRRYTISPNNKWTRGPRKKIQAEKKRQKKWAELASDPYAKFHTVYSPAQGTGETWNGDGVPQHHKVGWKQGRKPHQRYVDQIIAIDPKTGVKAVFNGVMHAAILLHQIFPRHFEKPYYTTARIKHAMDNEVPVHGIYFYAGTQIPPYFPWELPAQVNPVRKVLEMSTASVTWSDSDKRELTLLRPNSFSGIGHRYTQMPNTISIL